MKVAEQRIIEQETIQKIIEIIVKEMNPEKNLIQKKLISEIAWEISYEHEILLAPITYSLEKFNYPAIHKSSFIQNILREGIAA